MTIVTQLDNNAYLRWPERHLPKIGGKHQIVKYKTKYKWQRRYNTILKPMGRMARNYVKNESE
jgi:hypothetical protein